VSAAGKVARAKVAAAKIAVGRIVVRRTIAAAMRLMALAVVVAIIAVRPAPAETLVASTSQSRIEIASDFAGADLTVFGIVERDAATVARRGGYDVVVVVRGPTEVVASRRKDRFLGIWVTRAARTFPRTPSFYALASTRPLEAITAPAILARHDIGLGHASFGEEPVDLADPFRLALIRLRTESGLFAERPGTVDMLTPTFFRTTIPLPATVTDGRYPVTVTLFADGALLAEADLELVIGKIGFEAAVHDLSVHRPLAYGLGVVAMALLTGWIGGVVFRRD